MAYGELRPGLAMSGPTGYVHWGRVTTPGKYGDRGMLLCDRGGWLFGELFFPKGAVDADKECPECAAKKAALEGPARVGKGGQMEMVL